MMCKIANDLWWHHITIYNLLSFVICLKYATCFSDNHPYAHKQTLDPQKVIFNKLRWGWNGIEHKRMSVSEQCNNDASRVWENPIILAYKLCGSGGEMNKKDSKDRMCGHQNVLAIIRYPLCLNWPRTIVPNWVVFSSSGTVSMVCAGQQ